MLGAMRVGLLARWMGVLGIFTGVLIFLPIGGATLELVPAFWLVTMGMLCAGALAERRPAGLDLGRSAPMAFAADQRAAREAGGGEALAGAGAGRRQCCRRSTAPAAAPRASAGASAARAAAKDSGSSADPRRRRQWAITAYRALDRWPERMILRSDGWFLAFWE